MNADNWGTCPRCFRGAQEEYKKNLAQAENAYGRLPEAEYNDLVNRINAGAQYYRATLREDWEIWTNIHGKFVVKYQSRCEVCGFTFSFEHTEQVAIEEDSNAD